MSKENQTSNDNSPEDKIGTIKENTINDDEKEKVINDLKESSKDLGIFGASLLKPIQKYINKKRDSMPEEKRKHIQKMMKDIKDESNKGVGSVKKNIKKFWIIIKTKIPGKKNGKGQDENKPEKTNDSGETSKKENISNQSDSQAKE